MSDTERLREIAFAAKAHWGYDRDLVRAWADAIEFPPDEHVIVEDGGWAAVVVNGEVCWLDDLWVEPAAMGRGLGRRLFEQAAELARTGARRWNGRPSRTRSASTSAWARPTSATARRRSGGGSCP